MTELYIKNMVCQRCVQVVEDLIRKQGLQVLEINMGVVKLAQKPEPHILAEIASSLRQHGFELLDSTRMRIIERLKNIIIQKIHHAENLDIKVNWSILLSDELNQDYNSLSTLFSSVEGITLEQYIIRQKIERVKELLFYDELNLSEISYKLGYSSVQHLSTQFKKITGQTPSKFKLSREIEKVRKPLDSIL